MTLVGAIGLTIIVEKIEVPLILIDTDVGLYAIAPIAVKLLDPIEVGFLVPNTTHLKLEQLKASLPIDQLAVVILVKLIAVNALHPWNALAPILVKTLFGEKITLERAVQI